MELFTLLFRYCVYRNTHFVTHVLSACLQGLTIVHFSAQPKPFLVTEATASVHFSAQPETFVPMRPLNIAHKKCARQAQKWTSVVHKKCLR